jgi:hypothetical protein
VTDALNTRDAPDAVHDVMGGDAGGFVDDEDA